MTEAEIELIARRAAERAVHDVFEHLGVDVEQQEQVNAARADWIWARRCRKLAERIGTGIIVSLIALASVALATGLLEVFKTKIGVK
ncbi:MAG: hypothetical protein ACE5EM_13180 [Sphingomonadales bacterium]